MEGWFPALDNGDGDGVLVVFEQLAAAVSRSPRLTRFLAAMLLCSLLCNALCLLNGGAAIKRHR